MVGERMEQTRLVIIYEDSGSVSVYANNPHADKEELLAMLIAHTVHFIRNMSLENVPPSDAVEMVETAIKLAVNRFTENEKGV